MLKLAVQALVILIGGAFLLVWVDNIPRPQPAQSSHYQRAKEADTTYCCDHTPETWGKRLACDPVAGFTGLLALFTFVLGAVAIIQIDFLRRSDKNTKLAAEAASLHAKAAVGVELPMVFLSELSLFQQSPYNKTDTIPVIDNPPAFYFFHKFTFANHGRSPAQVAEITWNQYVGEVLPEGLLRDIKEWEPTGTMISPHGGTFICESSNRILLLDEEKAEIRKKEARLWLFGAISYRDFLGTLHERRFCGVWWCPDQPSLTPCGFGEGGPESYHGSS